MKNMSRFTPYLGIVAALAFAAFVGVFTDSMIISRTPARDILATSSTLSVPPGFTLLPITLPSLESRTGVPAVVLPSSAVEPAPKEEVPVTPILESAPVSAAALDAAASALRGALVNIICYVPAGSGLRSTSGSGTFIDPKGIILTNAHIAQYFLLADHGASCTIRTGSPAADSYEAALIYLSPVWLEKNASVLTQSAPSGTGEYDFAYLAVTKSVTRNALPASFPSVPLATIPPVAGTPVVIATYGAQFLESSQVRFSLFPTVVFGSVKDVFTFARNTIDVLALGGSAAAQEGSSGGGVADSSGALVGTITTSTIEGATDTRSLSAITASYIRAEYANETGRALDLLLAEPTAIAVADFATKIPALESIITAHLP